ncbi:DUF4352 domain-containing protein [Paenisporosarcina sp. NPDC076898]|uniref:DUF4352 domain-containing protein n=1 Tax=unclassified Paenisporosarcina TaxID=2642018 RepID=UPI003D01923B
MTNQQMSKEELKQAKKDAKNLLKKPFYKKVWFWALVVIVLIIAANGGGEDTGTTDTASGDSGKEETKVETSAPAKTEAKKETKKEEVKVAGVGEVVKVGDVEFIVNSTSTAKSVGGEYGEKSQGTYLLINVSVKNVGTEAITTDSSFFQLKSGEKTFDADSTAAIYANPDTEFFLEQVNPDLTAKGYVVFDVSDEVLNNPELMLQVQTGFFGTETGLIKIAQ